MRVVADEGWRPLALDAAGPFAAPLVSTSWMLFAMGGAVFLIVLLALGVALFGGPRLRALVGQRRLIIIGGLAFPIVVLSAVLIYGLTLTARLSDPPGAGELRVRVVGEMWWWRVLYFEGDRVAFETANEIVIPAGRPVTFELESADVIHSFWVPQLGAKLDMIPGRRNLLRLQADAPGIYRGQCTEFCGAAHALMAFEVIAVSETAFATWRAAQAQPALAEASRGRAVFASVGCGACHSVRGTEANGRMGPDLTHLASRRTLAAGILPNDRQTLERWIDNPDALKPGVRMPAYERLADADRAALTLYLESLQ